MAGGDYERSREGFLLNLPLPDFPVSSHKWGSCLSGQNRRRLEPGFTAEAWVDNDFYQPGGSSAALFFDGARKAGLPLCAKPEAAAKFDPRNLLQECEAERAKAAAPKM